MNIIGINAFHADSAACIVIDGKLIAAVEEERFNRIKHWAGFPIKSIKHCLSVTGLKISEIDHISINIASSKAGIIKRSISESIRYNSSPRKFFSIVKAIIRKTTVDKK